MRFTAPWITPSLEYDILDRQKVAVFSSTIQGYQAEGSVSVVSGAEFRFTIQKYVKSGTEECFKLIKVYRLSEDDLLDQVKISCEYGVPSRPRGFCVHFEAVIYENPPSAVLYVVEDGYCVNRQYGKSLTGITREDSTLSEAECESYTKRSRTERTNGYVAGTEPITPEDIMLMDEQIVTLMARSVKHFKTLRSQFTFYTVDYEVEVKEYFDSPLCVKVVSLKRKDLNEYFDHVKVSCKITGPIITNEEDYLLNYGNVIYVLDSFTIVFVVQDGACLQRIYHVQAGGVAYQADSTLSPPDCYQLTRWHQSQRRTKAKLNEQPPPRNLRNPGLMRLLSMNVNITGYGGGLGKNTLRGGELELQREDFFKGDEDCVRLLVVKVHGTEVDRVMASCGAIRDIRVDDHGIRYGKAFAFKPQTGTNSYIGVFNILRDGSCIKKTYIVDHWNPAKFSESPDAIISGKECEDLVEE